MVFLYRMTRYKQCLLLTCFLCFHVSRIRMSKVFYKLPDKYLNGHVIKVMYVDEPTECVGMCMHMGKCVAFNVEQAKDGGAHTCEFLSENRCGFVDEKKSNVMFTSHRQCAFKLRMKSNWKCIARTESGFLREAADDDKCVVFQLNLDGTGFKIDDRCLAVKKEQGPVEVDWLVLSNFTDDDKCQVHFSGDDQQFQITEISSKKCVSNFKYGTHTYLILDECGSKNYYKMQWQDYPSADTTEEMARQHIPYVPYVATFPPVVTSSKKKEVQEVLPQPPQPGAVDLDFD